MSHLGPPVRLQKMARPGDPLGADWWPGQQTGGGLWELQDEMGAAIWRAGEEQRESQAGGSSVNFPVQGPLSGQEKRPGDQAKQRPAGQTGHQL